MTCALQNLSNNADADSTDSCGVAAKAVRRTLRRLGIEFADIPKPFRAQVRVWAAALTEAQIASVEEIGKEGRAPGEGHCVDGQPRDLHGRFTKLDELDPKRAAERLTGR